MGSRRGQGLKVARGQSPVGVRKKSSANPIAMSGRGDALQGMLVLAAATQHAEGHKEQAVAAAAAPAGAEQQPQLRRHESPTSDNDYSEGLYAPPQRTAQRGGGHPESEEEKKEKRRLANREAARRMRRRRATHMAAVEEEVERLSQENSLLLHRLSQLVASHQVVDAENQQLRAELLALRQSVVGQMDLAGASLAPLAAKPALAAGAVMAPPTLAPAELEPAATKVNGEVPSAPATVVRPVAAGAAALPSAVLDGLSARLGMPSSSGGHSTENDMTATEEERVLFQAGMARERDLSLGSSGGEGAPAPHMSVGRTARKRGTWKPLDE